MVSNFAFYFITCYIKERNNVFLLYVKECTIMINLNHDAESFDPAQLPQDYAVFYLNSEEAAGPPRTVTPYMKACAFYLANELDYSDGKKGFIGRLWARIGGGLMWAGFFMMIFGVPLAFDPGRVQLHWLGWVMAILGLLFFGGHWAAILAEILMSRRGYDQVLAKGNIHQAVVKQHLVEDGMVRELRFHKPVMDNGVPIFERQWVMRSWITISIENTETEFTTFRPEIIEVFDAGKKIPVLWNRKWPELFIPIKD